MRSLVHEFNKRSLTVHDICTITLDLHIAKLRSGQVFKCIVEYCGLMDFNSKRFVQEAGLQTSIRFFHAVAICYGEVSNKAFLGIIRDFMKENIDDFDLWQAEKMLHLFKYINDLYDPDLKRMLEQKLSKLEHRGAQAFV